MCNDDSVVRFVHELAETSPEVKQLYDAHIAANNGLVPREFLRDVSWYIVERAGCEDNAVPISGEGLFPEPILDEIRPIMDFLEQSLSGQDEAVRELIRVEFLELLDYEDYTIARLSIRKFLGPNLVKMLIDLGW